MQKGRKPGAETDRYVRGDHVGADGVTLYSRAQAARFLGIQLSSVKAAEVRGALFATVTRGVHCFSRAELERYRTKTKHGVIASAVFDALAAGKSPAKIVAEQQVAPALMRELVHDYCELSEQMLCAAPKGTRKAWESAFGVQLTPELILRAVELAARTPSIRQRLVA